MTDCRLLILIFAFVFIACNSRSERVDSSDNAGQSIINTSIVKLTIDTISSSDFISRFPQGEVVSQLEGFTVFDRTDRTYFPNDATVSVIEISAVKNLFMLEKEGYVMLYLVDAGKIYNDAFQVPDSITTYKKGKDLFVDGHFFTAKARIERFRIDETNNFDYSETPLPGSVNPSN